ADGDEPGELQAARQSAADDVGAKSPTLRHDANRSDVDRPDLGEGHPPARRVDAQAIGSDEAHAAGTRGAGELVLQRLAFIHFAKAARNDLRVAYAPVRLREKRRNLRRSDGDVGVVHRVRRFAQTPVSLEAVDFRGGGMNRINLSLVAELADAADEHVG